jgi:hypothetical protein
MHIHVRDVTMRTEDVIPTIEIKEGDAYIHTSSIIYPHVARVCTSFTCKKIQ